QPECPQLKLVRMEGAIYFGAVRHVSDRLNDFRADRPQQIHLLVMARSMNFIDLAGSDLWESELADRRASGGDLYFHRPRIQVVRVWKRSGFAERLGSENVFSTKREALSTIFGKLDPGVCAKCTARIFEECKGLPVADSGGEAGCSSATNNGSEA
ncbi:MAG: sodium-independent anion transporter, partial [Burkholderiales bacterium]